MDKYYFVSYHFKSWLCSEYDDNCVINESPLDFYVRN